MDTSHPQPKCEAVTITYTPQSSHKEKNDESPALSQDTRKYMAPQIPVLPLCPLLAPAITMATENSTKDS